VTGEHRPVVVRFELTPWEYAEGMRVILRRQPTMWVAPVVASATIVAGVTSGAIIAMVWGAVVLALGIASFYLAPALRFRQNARLGLDQEHTFSGTGISVRAGKERGHLPWGFYIAVRETPHVYVLLRTAREANFIAKRGFGTPDDEERFRALAADHLQVSWRT
jgi:hypothetical protein